MKRCLFFLFAVVASLPVAFPAWAMSDDHATVDSGLLTLQQRWAQIKYKTPKAERRHAFALLLHQTEALHHLYPNRADVAVWSAVVLYNYAGEVGGIRALGMVKRSYRILKRLEKTDPKAAQGLVHSALGQLYYKVPGWPVAFGDEARAEYFLRKGIAQRPDGLDANYFMGDYLLRKKQYCQAAIHLRIAIHAPARAARSIADAGRKADAMKLLKLAEIHIHQQKSGTRSLSRHNGCGQSRPS